MKKLNPHLQTLIILATLFVFGAALTVVPVVMIFVLLFLIVYATIYVDIVKQQKEDGNK